jgi:hypothetical protein
MQTALRNKHQQALESSQGEKTLSGLALSDCHAAEHLLIGTHQLDNSLAKKPICLTCRLQSAA